MGYVMTEMTFEVRADLTQFVAEIQKGDRAMNLFVANVAMAPAALTRAFAVLGRGGKAVTAFAGRAEQAISFLEKIAQTAKGTAEFASSIDRVAKLAGVSAEALQEFRFAATQSGADIGTFDKALIGFGERLREARKGSGEFYELLASKGISLNDAEGRARSLEAVFFDFAEAVRNAQKPIEQSEMAIAGFGTEGAVLVDLLARGREGIAAFQRQARELGVVLNRHLVKEVKEANAQFAKLEQVVDVNLARAVSAGLPEFAVRVDDLASHGPSLKGLTESFLPDDLRSSEALRSKIEELGEKLRQLQHPGDPADGAIDPKSAPPGSLERLRLLKMEELQKAIAKLVALLLHREQEDAASRRAGAFDRPRPRQVGFDAPGDSLLQLDESLGETAQSYARLNEEAGRFEAQGGSLTELLDATNDRFGLQAGLLGSLQRQVPELAEAMTGFFGETTEGVARLDGAVQAVGDRFLDAFEGAIRRGESLSDVIKGLGVDLAELALSDIKTGGLLGGFLNSLVPGGLSGTGPRTFTLFENLLPSAAMLSGPFAKGGAFERGRTLTSFARGGALTNSIINRPTLFPMADGAGLMGESGPEAVLPLTRLANGELGVSMPGGAAPAAAAGPPMQFFIDARGADRDGMRALTAAIRDVKAEVRYVNNTLERRAVGAVAYARGRGGNIARAFGGW
jgi:hypothetical protein